MYSMLCLFQKQRRFCAHLCFAFITLFHMEEQEHSEQTVSQSFQFDFANYELIAQGAEGVWVFGGLNA